MDTNAPKCHQHQTSYASPKPDCHQTINTASKWHADQNAHTSPQYYQHKTRNAPPNRNNCHHRYCANR
jgi:hypothetical protein